MKRLVIANIVLILSGLAGPLAQALAAGDMRADASSNMPEGAAAKNGDVAELEHLTAAGKITELRKSFNGSYGASLSYFPEQMTYYAALFQQSTIWRVFKTQNDGRAEAVYFDFAKTSMTLADAEIKRIKLEAEKAYADRQIAAQQERAGRLQADLDIARAQQGQVTSYQQEQQNAVRELRTEQAAAQAQLRALQLRVQELQKQADGDLPAPAR
ncbi:signal peptide protein [Caballeronia catudaia]|uniref:Signal peptide protein n=2 Tax=Caballeronia catudaia TaxID=1777136 RepID=A0A158CES8_9BURK|nr:signal peptide protein [Caballeronia catudaia]